MRVCVYGRSIRPRGESTREGPGTKAAYILTRCVCKRRSTRTPQVPPTCTAVPRLPETRRRAHGQGPTVEGEWKQGPRRALCPLQQECTRRPPLMSLSVIVHRPGKTGTGAIFSLRAGPWDRRSASARAQRPWLTGQRIGRPPLQSSQPSPARTARTELPNMENKANQLPELVVWGPVLLNPLPPELCPGGQCCSNRGRQHWWSGSQRCSNRCRHN